MIIITKDDIYNYLTDQDLNKIDKNIKSKLYFYNLKESLNKSDAKLILYNQKYFYISYGFWFNYIKIIIINNNNYNDIKIYIKYPNNDRVFYDMMYNISVEHDFSINKKRIDYNNTIIDYYLNNNYKFIKKGHINKKILLKYKMNYYYYIYYYNHTSLYYFNKYFVFILKKCRFRYIIIKKFNLNNIIINLLFFVYIYICIYYIMIIITKDNISNYLTDQDINIIIKNKKIK